MNNIFMKRCIWAAVIVCICLVFVGCGGKKQEQSRYIDGTYEGRALGFNANITLMVTVENDDITEITVVSHAEDEVYWTNATKVIDDIVASDSTEVDAVSGATYSSMGIIGAVDSALLKADRPAE